MSVGSGCRRSLSTHPTPSHPLDPPMKISPVKWSLFFFALSDYHGQSCWRSKAQGKPRLGWRLIQISESKSSYDAGPYNLIITGCHLGQMCSELISLISSTYSSCTRTHRNWVAILDLFTISGGQYWHKKNINKVKLFSLGWFCIYFIYGAMLKYVCRTALVWRIL